jgi:hypothetical protein
VRGGGGSTESREGSLCSFSPWPPRNTESKGAAFLLELTLTVIDALVPTNLVFNSSQEWYNAIIQISPRKSSIFSLHNTLNEVPLFNSLGVKLVTRSFFFCSKLLFLVSRSGVLSSYGRRGRGKTFTE